jgi:hypothetical protein
MIPPIMFIIGIGDENKPTIRNRENEIIPSMEMFKKIWIFFLKLSGKSSNWLKK